MHDPEAGQQTPYVMEMEPGTYAWCRCGRSARQPFCDGSHAGTELGPEVVTIEKRKNVAWCGCKRSGKPPLCDGTHSRLP